MRITAKIGNMKKVFPIEQSLVDEMIKKAPRKGDVIGPGLIVG